MSLRLDSDPDPWQGSDGPGLMQSAALFHYR